MPIKTPMHLNGNNIVKKLSENDMDMLFNKANKIAKRNLVHSKSNQAVDNETILKKGIELATKIVAKDKEYIK